MKAAAAHIRNAMRQHSLNQKQAAERLGISESYLSKILAGTAPVSAFVAVRLLATMNIDGRKLLLDQTLVEYERAKLEYTREVAG